MTETAMSVGLRQRKKLATREALSAAALRLAGERGVEQVRVEDIAAEAGVSPRTFNNYFSSKEEAVVAGAGDWAAGIASGLRDRPLDEPLLDALRNVLAGRGGQRFDRDRIARIRLAASTPALLGEYLKAMLRSERLLAEAIAERTGTDLTQDVYPRVLAASVSGAMRVALGHWFVSGTTSPFATLLSQAVEQAVLGARTADRGEQR